MLMTCKIENAKFKKPAKSRLAVKPMGHPQKRAPGGVVNWVAVASVHCAFMAKATDFDESAHKDLTPASQTDTPPESWAIVHELLVCVKDKMMTKEDQKIPKPANIFALWTIIR